MPRQRKIRVSLTEAQLNALIYALNEAWVEVEEIDGDGYAETDIDSAEQALLIARETLRTQTAA